MTRPSPLSGLIAAACLATSLPGGAAANPMRAEALSAFAANCFSPHLTARTAEAALAAHGRHDFYDLNPFSAPAPSPAATEVTPGTDRRCELAFDGDAGEAAAQVAADALAAEGITREARIPATHAEAALPGTTLLGARFLNPGRIAVVHTGTRPGPNGPETFLYVERLTPEASLQEIPQ